MTLLVVGSVALDSLETPHGAVDSVLGGSSVYFSLAASFFAPVRLVGVIGRDFPQEHKELLQSRAIDTGGMVAKEGSTFAWKGRYSGAMNEAETLDVRLNVFEEFMPEVPEKFRDSPFAFLANCSPHTQLHVRKQLSDDAFVMADTMNLWIETERDALLELFGNVDGIVLNDDEARQVSAEHNLIHAGRWICERGPEWCVIKKAEHGALLIGADVFFALPGYPAETVYDPTGAGDSFAGGLMGRLAEEGEVNGKTLRSALAYGSVVASFAIERFGTNRLCEIERADIERRLEEFREYIRL